MNRLRPRNVTRRVFLGGMTLGAAAAAPMMAPEEVAAASTPEIQNAQPSPGQTTDHVIRHSASADATGGAVRGFPSEGQPRHHR